jgi:glutaredoxin
MHDVVLYTREVCHLCEEAAALLARHGLVAWRVDIDADPALQQRYDQCVPVVVIDGKERFRGRVNEVLLTRLLADGRARDEQVGDG